MFHSRNPTICEIERETRTESARFTTTTQRSRSRNTRNTWMCYKNVKGKGLSFLKNKGFLCRKVKATVFWKWAPCQCPTPAPRLTNTPGHARDVSTERGGFRRNLPQIPNWHPNTPVLSLVSTTPSADMPAWAYDTVFFFGTQLLPIHLTLWLLSQTPEGAASIPEGRHLLRALGSGALEG